MAGPSFDPTHAVRFDLPRGSVRAGGDGDRVLLLPAAALETLLRSASAETVEGVGRTMGAGIGGRAAARMGNVQDASVEAFVTHLAGEAAVAGLGTWSVERWGRALVVVVENSPLPPELFAAVVRGALEAASGRRVWCAVVSSSEHSTRVLVGNDTTIARIRGWVAKGVGWIEAVGKLHEGAP